MSRSERSFELCIWDAGALTWPNSGQACMAYVVGCPIRGAPRSSRLNACTEGEAMITSHRLVMQVVAAAILLLILLLPRSVLGEGALGPAALAARHATLAPE